MLLHIIKFGIFAATLLSSVAFFHLATFQKQNEILLLTEKFHEAYKNQDENLINQLVADDFVNTYYGNKYGYGKSELIAGMKLSKAEIGEVISIEITPLWIQADRAKPSITFETKGTVLHDGETKPSIYYGQYTFVFERRENALKIVAMNFDVNYMQHKPHWLERKYISSEKTIKSLASPFGRNL
jgi:hypothetical protein